MITDPIAPVTFPASGFASTSSYESDQTLIAGQTSSLAVKATRAITQVLSGANLRKPRTFIEALEKNIQIKRVNGVSVTSWAPVGAGVVAGTSTLTGAMGAFFRRASARLELARAELRKLEPMCEADYEQCCEDLTEVIRGKLDELEGALGADCGPCSRWVEEIFTELLGAPSSNEGGLVDLLEKEYTTGAIPNCAEEERRLADLSLFQVGLSGLRIEWYEFKRKFITRQRSLSIITLRLTNRAKVMSAGIGRIRHGLNFAGYGSAWLAVEKAESDDFSNVCCLLDRMERFATVRSVELLQSPGQGAFRSLADEAQHLRKASCQFHQWLTGTFNPKDLDCPAPAQGRSKREDDQFVRVAEMTGPINLGWQGVVFASRILVEQISEFHEEVTTAADLFKSRRSRGIPSHPVPETDCDDDEPTDEEQYIGKPAEKPQKKSTGPTKK